MDKMDFALSCKKFLYFSISKNSVMVEFLCLVKIFSNVILKVQVYFIYDSRFLF